MNLEDIDVEHVFADNDLYAKQVKIPAGTTLEQHKHPYSHISVVAKGIAWVTVDGKTFQMTEGTHTVIAAGKIHYVHAQTDVVWYCIHNCPEKDPDKVDNAILHAQV